MQPIDPEAMVAKAASRAATGAEAAGSTSAKLAFRNTPIHAHIA